MKKFLTLRNIVLAAGALVAIVGFVLTFFADVAYDLGGGYAMEYKGVIYGCSKLVYAGQEFTIAEFTEGVFGIRVEKYGLMVVPFIGALLMVVGAVAACVVGLLVKKPFAKWIVLACGVVVLAGGIMQFFPLEAFADAEVRAVYGAAGVTDEEAIKEAVQNDLEALKEAGAKCTLAIVSGILACVGGVAAGASAFLGKKGE